MPSLTIVNAEVDGHVLLDLRIAEGRIVAMGCALARRPGEAVLDAAGGAVLPGLHDHHVHLLALAAADASVKCGPPDVLDASGLRRVLTAGEPRRWLRGIGYHESVAGDLDRWTLDRLVADRPVRVQHRSGMLWVVNSIAVEQLGLAGPDVPPGVERDEHGRPTGRLIRLDNWLRSRLGGAQPPSLRAVGRRLASFGVTGVTDATAGNGPDELRAFAAALRAGDLPQRLLVMGSVALPEIGLQAAGSLDPSGLLVMGSVALPEVEHARLGRGAVKVVLDEHALPSLAELCAVVGAARRQERAVSFHCVTRASLVLAVTAVREAGARRGDRIEHASVVPPALVDLVASLPLTIVTQPGFVHERGDAYLRDVPAEEQPWLYRCRGFLDAGIPLAAGSDAPFGDPNPWRAMQAAVDRRTPGGRLLGGDERLTPEAALALFTTPLEDPGSAPRRVAVGAPADLCVLGLPWAKMRERLESDAVRSTLVGGTVAAPAPAH